MACDLLIDNAKDRACFYSTTTETAFGPVMDAEEAETFDAWIGGDARKFTDAELVEKLAEFRAINKYFSDCSDADEKHVRKQALSLVEVKWRDISQSHPWGSTTARENLAEPELLTDEVEIPIETATLPDEFTAKHIDGDGYELELTFKPHGGPLPKVTGGYVTYMVEMA